MHTGRLIGAAAVAVLAGSASAELVGSFGFTELNASFSLDTMVFEAIADSANGLATTGDVTSLEIPGSPTAVFNPGFFTGGTVADVQFRMDIVSNDGVTAQAENGRILIRDADGDTISGTFVGEWTVRSGFIFFSGDLASVLFSDSGGDGNFDGPGGGSFENIAGELFGALSMLMEEDGALFGADFEGRVNSADGLLVVPSPGASSLALMGAAVLLPRGRRR